jgi:hypothetical protein
MVNSSGVGRHSLKSMVQDVRQPHPCLLQLKLDRRVGLTFVGWSDWGRIRVGEILVSHGLCEPVTLQRPVLDAASHPFLPVLARDSALQLHRESFRASVDVLQQAGVPDPVQVVGPSVKDDMTHIPALVVVILIVQWLMKVTDEMDNVL